jgi:DNA invertase Pin-like site-specific DNA recombinase
MTRKGAAPLTAVGYIRVSTEEQTKGGVSLEAQESRIRAYCAGSGLNLAGVFRDEGVSGSKPLSKRTGGTALLKAIANREAQHVVVVMLDRAFRNTVDCLTTVQAWDRARVALHLVDHGGQSINSASAVGRMFLTMLAGFAEMERRLAGERIGAALRHKKAQGRAYARTPYGYDRQGEGLTPNPAELAVVRRVHRWRQHGRSPEWIAGELTRQGAPTKRGGRWHPCTVRYLLKNPLYQREEVA